MSTGFPLPEIGDILHEKYQVTRRIGAGSFGAIFEVQNLENGKLFAVKLENPKVPTPQLSTEHKLYVLLDAPPGIPRVYDYWSEPSFRAMIMDRLGYSLGYRFHECGKILSMKTVLMCGIQMICRLEYLHQRSFVHRDIKPDNFVFGVGNDSNLLYLIDLGLAQTYRDINTMVHNIYKEDKGLVGTARYVSVNVHLGVEQSCRDDLESVGYVLISLVKGKLPWQELEAVSKNEKYELLSQAKMDTPLETLCQGLPSEFLNYMTRVRNLRYDERPAYTILRGLFINVMVKENYSFDYKYDWVINKTQRLNEALQGTAEEKKIVIKMPPNEIKGAMKIKNSERNGFWQPLPFFAIMDEAAQFVGKSRKGMEKPPDDDQNAGGFKLPPEQDFFLFDRHTTTIPRNPVDIEFEPGDKVSAQQ